MVCLKIAVAFKNLLKLFEIKTKDFFLKLSPHNFSYFCFQKRLLSSFWGWSVNNCKIFAGFWPFGISYLSEKIRVVSVQKLSILDNRMVYICPLNLVMVLQSSTDFLLVLFVFDSPKIIWFILMLILPIFDWHYSNNLSKS